MAAGRPQRACGPASVFYLIVRSSDAAAPVAGSLYPMFVRGALGQNKIASIYRSLLRAGFSSDIIRAELRGVTHGTLPEFTDTSDSEL